MPVVAVGLAVADLVAGSERQQTPFETVTDGSGRGAMRGAERLVEVEGEMDRDKRVENERQRCEPNRPRRATQPMR